MRSANTVYAHAMSEAMKKMPLVDRLQLAYGESNGSIITLTNGGDTAAIILYLLREGFLTDVPLVFLDTWRYPSSTYKLIAKLGQKHKVIQFDPSHVNKTYDDVQTEEGVREIKGMLLEHALQTLKPEVIVSGIMHWETPERAKKEILEWDGNYFRLHPILDLTEEAAHDFIERYKLPRNPLHHDVAKGDDQKKECGINEYRENA